MALKYFRFVANGHSALLLKWLPWIIGIPLRLFSFVWPLAIEVLALLWWGASSELTTVLLGFCFILPYLYLIFFPNRLVFSVKGIFAAFILISVSLGMVVYRLLSAEEVYSLLWEHISLGLIWMLAIYLVMITREKQVDAP